MMESNKLELLLSFSSQSGQNQRWAINLEGVVVEIPEEVLAEIKVNPTRTMGWFNKKLLKTWKFIFPLTEMSAKEGGLSLLDPAWKAVKNAWWNFMADLLMTEGERCWVWESLPQISPTPILFEVDPMECLSEWRMLERLPISTFIMGNKHTTKIIQVFQPTMVFNMHVAVQEMEMGVLQHNLTMLPKEGQTKEMVNWVGWNLREEAKLLPPFDECPTSEHSLIMNIIVWNCRGALKPSF